MPPIVSIVGYSNSGKTTLIEKLLGELKARGYKVGTIKHAGQEIISDTGKDSWRHLQAGSGATVVSSPGRIVLVKPTPPDVTLNDIVPLFGEEFDIILTEGFKQDDAPKIEVRRRGIGAPLVDIKKLIAVVSDEPGSETKPPRQFSFDDVKALADLLEEGFIKPQRERLSLYVNGVPIVLSAFPKEFITNVLLAMSSSLKGVGQIESLTVFLKRAK